MPFAQSQGGVRIGYEIFGTGPFPLLLLHGWGGSASYWREMVQQMEWEGLRVIAPSYRGHGDSDKPANGYTVDQFAKDVLAVAGAAGAKRFVQVGFSMSGKFAQYIAALHRDRVLGLVLIAPVPASEFPIPAEVGKAWCDAQQNRDDFKRILYPVCEDTDQKGTHRGVSRRFSEGGSGGAGADVGDVCDCACRTRGTNSGSNAPVGRQLRSTRTARSVTEHSPIPDREGEDDRAALRTRNPAGDAGTNCGAVGGVCFGAGPVCHGSCMTPARTPVFPRDGMAIRED